MLMFCTEMIHIYKNIELECLEGAAKDKPLYKMSTLVACHRAHFSLYNDMPLLVHG